MQSMVMEDQDPTEATLFLVVSCSSFLPSLSMIVQVIMLFYLVVVLILIGTAVRGDKGDR